MCNHKWERQCWYGNTGQLWKQEDGTVHQRMYQVCKFCNLALSLENSRGCVHSSVPASSNGTRGPEAAFGGIFD